jgi:hypothetical protein
MLLAGVDTLPPEETPAAASGFPAVPASAFVFVVVAIPNTSLGENANDLSRPD